MSLTDISKLRSEGRTFDCRECKESIKKLRHCEDDREDFTEKDGPFWPIQIYQGGELYPFCPGKATWDIELVSIFRLLILAAETGNICLNSGGICEQPDWWIDNVSWFIPRYKQIQFVQRVKMVVGDGKVSSAKTPKLKK